jgi:hypothetical protein
MHCTLACDLPASLLARDLHPDPLSAGNVNMLLPNAWLWSMVDEFLYQFQSFAQYRAKLSSKSAEEIELLKKCDKVGRCCFCFISSGLSCG